MGAELLLSLPREGRAQSACRQLRIDQQTPGRPGSVTFSLSNHLEGPVGDLGTGQKWLGKKLSKTRGGAPPFSGMWVATDELGGGWSPQSAAVGRSGSLAPRLLSSWLIHSPVISGPGESGFFFPSKQRAAAQWMSLAIWGAPQGLHLHMTPVDIWNPQLLDGSSVDNCISSGWMGYSVDSWISSGWMGSLMDGRDKRWYSHL